MIYEDKESKEMMRILSENKKKGQIKAAKQKKANEKDEIIKNMSLIMLSSAITIFVFSIVICVIVS